MAKKLQNTATSDAETAPFPLPDFDLPYETGKTLNRKDLLGKWTVLFLYPTDNTPTCTREAVEFSAALDQFESLNCVVIGLSKDDLKSHARFKTKHSLNMPLLSDETTDFINALGAWDQKQLYGKTYMGTVRSTFLIDPQGVVQAQWRNLKVNGHVEAVLETLKAKQAVA